MFMKNSWQHLHLRQKKMLLKNPISNTKKFFQKTIHNVKSFLSSGSTYQKLPKTPPFHSSCDRDANATECDARYNNHKMDFFYNEFTNQWDLRKSKTKNKNKAQTKKIRASTKKSQQFFPDDTCQKENCTHHNYATRNEENISYIYKEKIVEREGIVKSKGINLTPSDIVNSYDLCSRSVREKRLCFVAEKLEELEVIDRQNFDHKLDFEEILYCYSRLTCPAYLDIVDKFLLEMCRDFYGPRASLKVINSRSR